VWWKNRKLLLLLLLSACLLFPGLSGWGVVETSEARYAEISREMFHSGDFIHPTLLKIRHFHKPPLTYWITSTAYSMFGVNVFSEVALLLVSSFSLVLFYFDILSTELFLIVSVNLAAVFIFLLHLFTRKPTKSLISFPGQSIYVLVWPF
jgi:4-amino-4-deoxy-L-arabinose transferase